LVIPNPVLKQLSEKPTIISYGFISDEAATFLTLHVLFIPTHIMNKIRILLVEDHKLIRETWTSMLNSDERFEVIGAYGDTKEAISFALLEHPDIVLMDININPLNGFQATTRLTEIVPKSKVIALSFHSEMVFVQKMFASGAKGYMTKNSGCEELTDAIIRVHAGNQYVCAEVRDKGFEVVPLSQVKGPATYLLTNKEIQVSHYLQDGLPTKEIAGKLNISARTVSVHRYNIFKKLDVNNSVSLINLLNSRHDYINYSTQKSQDE
jgi:DNA-binding NarL/FixJ family response regulator